MNSHLPYLLLAGFSLQNNIEGFYRQHVTSVSLFEASLCNARTVFTNQFTTQGTKH